MRREGAANKHAPSARLRVIVNKNVHDTYPRSAVLQKICEICEICGPAGVLRPQRPSFFLSPPLLSDPLAFFQPKMIRKKERSHGRWTVAVALS